MSSRKPAPRGKAKVSTNKKSESKSSKRRQVSESDSESLSDSESDNDSLRETLVMEVPISEKKIKQLLKGREASNNNNLKPIPKAETRDVDQVCPNCPKYQKNIREMKKRLKGASIDDEPDRIALTIPAIDKTGKTIRFRNMPGRVCDWCTEGFEWEPTMLPQCMVGDVVRMTDYFCSAECSAAYNLYFLNDKDIWKRKTLIDRMETIRRGQPTIVKPASSPRLMKKFGGNYTVSEYRKLNGTGKRSYRPLPSSVIPIVTVLESDQFGLTRNDEALVLKRETPLNNQSSLERSMKLRVNKNNAPDSDDEEV
jgi:hypothetical protein